MVVVVERVGGGVTSDVARLSGHKIRLREELSWLALCANFVHNSRMKSSVLIFLRTETRLTPKRSVQNYF